MTPRAGESIFRSMARRVRNVVIPAPVIFGRVACLGQSLYYMRSKELGRSQFLNQQKVRCDLFLDRLLGAPRPIASEVVEHLARDHVAPCIWEQEALPWVGTRRPPRLLLMDSFAELTDQKFVHRRDKWSFACHYRDLVHSEKFSADFECLGLLDPEQFERVYYDFFAWFFGKFPRSRIVFFHFPTKLDPRHQFRERAAVLRRVVEGFASSNSSILSVAVDDGLVEPSIETPHRYHFSRETNLAMVRVWQELERR